MNDAVEADGFVRAGLSSHKKYFCGAATGVLGRKVRGSAVDVYDHIRRIKFDLRVRMRRQII